MLWFFIYSNNIRVTYLYNVGAINIQIRYGICLLYTIYHQINIRSETV